MTFCALKTLGSHSFPPAAKPSSLPSSEMPPDPQFSADLLPTTLLWMLDPCSLSIVLCTPPPSHSLGFASELTSQFVIATPPVVKNPPANTRDTGSIPGSGRSPGGGNCNLLQYPCLENPVNRGAWRTAVHRVAKSQTQLGN